MSDSTYTLNYTGAEINSHLGITSKAAASGGTDESLVTTGEKYNWDNKVDGPNSSTNNQIAVFDGTTGKTIKDSGKTITTSISSDSDDTSVPTSKAVVDAFANAKIQGANLTTTAGSIAYYNDTDGTFASDGNLTWDSTNQILTAKKLKGYVIAGQKAETTLGSKATAEGLNTTASGDYSHAEGQNTTASYTCSHAEGFNTTAYGIGSHAEGKGTTAIGNYIGGAHAEGQTTTASARAAHAEGNETTASGEVSHAEGNGTIAFGYCSHAEGSTTITSEEMSHAEGRATIASGKYSHAEGKGYNAVRNNITYTTLEQNRYKLSQLPNGCKVSDKIIIGKKIYTISSIDSTDSTIITTSPNLPSSSEAQSIGVIIISPTIASGLVSHAEGYETTANHKSQHVFGEYNIADDSTAAATKRGNYVEIVGNGTSDNALSNARTLDWSGNEVLAGKLTVGTAPTGNMDVATKQYVDAKYTKPSGGIPDSDIASSSTWNAKAASTSIPTSASVDTSTGVMSFKNSDGTQLFTVTLPNYNGEVI